MAATFSIYFNTLKHRAKGFKLLRRRDGNLQLSDEPNLNTVYTRTYTHARTHARARAHSHTHIRIRTQNHTHTHTHTHARTHTHTHTHTSDQLHCHFHAVDPLYYTKDNTKCMKFRHLSGCHFEWSVVTT